MSHKGPLSVSSMPLQQKWKPVSSKTWWNMNVFNIQQILVNSGELIDFKKDIREMYTYQNISLRNHIILNTRNIYQQMFSKYYNARKRSEFRIVFVFRYSKQTYEYHFSAKMFACLHALPNFSWWNNGSVIQHS